MSEEEEKEQVRIIGHGWWVPGNGPFARFGGCDCCTEDKDLADMSIAELQEIVDTLNASIAIVQDVLRGRVPSSTGRAAAAAEGGRDRRAQPEAQRCGQCGRSWPCPNADLVSSHSPAHEVTE